MKLFRLCFTLAVYFSIATVTAEAGLLLAVALKGGLSEERLLQMLAVARDVDLHSIWKEMETEAKPIEEAQVSHSEVEHKRKEVALDLALREIATEKGLNDLRQLKKMVEQEKRRFDQLVDDFERWTKAREEGKQSQALQNTQAKLQAVTAKLAKQQLMKYLDDPDNFQFVVTIVKAMPLEKRKKILAEFKAMEDNERLHEILRRIRLGVPDVQRIRQTRERAQQFVTREQE